MKTERSYNSGSETPAARHTSANVPNRHLDEVADLGVLVPIIDQSHQTTFVVLPCPDVIGEAAGSGRRQGTR